MKRSLPFIIVQDLALTGLVLCIFALSHHVLPRYLGNDTASASPVPVAATAAPLAQEDWGEKFSDKFSSQVEQGEDYYRSRSISIEIERTETELDGDPQVWYVADIYIADIESFRTYVEDDEYTSYKVTDAQVLSDMAGAILAVNGDYCNAQAQEGFFVRNGIMYQQEQTSCDIAVLYMNGVLETYGPRDYQVQEILDRQPWQVWKFGPALLDGEGRPLESFNTTEAIAKPNPRTALGYYEPGHYCFVVSEGRMPDRSQGLTMAQLARLMSDLGCKAAYNLDGGASSSMVFQGQTQNLRTDNRLLGDILLIREVEP